MQRRLRRRNTHPQIRGVDVSILDHFRCRQVSLQLGGEIGERGLGEVEAGGGGRGGGCGPGEEDGEGCGGAVESGGGGEFEGEEGRAVGLEVGRVEGGAGGVAGVGFEPLSTSGRGGEADVDGLRLGCEV